MSSLLDLAAKLDTTGTVAELQSGLATAKSAFNSATNAINDAKGNVEEVKENASGIAKKFENWKLDKKFEKVNEDVSLSYDEATNTFKIDAGKIDPGTMSAFKDYLEEADGKYDDASIVIGPDVEFDQGKLKHINFGFKCKSLEIQSQNITDANSMFEDSEIEAITIADQPGLSDVDDMFKNCKAKEVTVGAIPSDVDKFAMQNGCKASFKTDVDDRAAQAEELAAEVAPQTDVVAEDTVTLD